MVLIILVDEDSHLLFNGILSGVIEIFIIRFVHFLLVCLCFKLFSYTSDTVVVEELLLLVLLSDFKAKGDFEEEVGFNWLCEEVVNYSAK